jgi:hypothetical protein
VGLEGISALIFLSPCIISSFCRFIDQLNYALLYRHAKIVLDNHIMHCHRIFQGTELLLSVLFNYCL